MTVKRSYGERVFSIFNAGFLIILSILMIYPLVYVAAASFSDPRQFLIYRGPLVWPRGFTLDAYKLVFQNPNIASGYVITLFLVSVGTFINVIVTIMGAYLLAQKGSIWSKPLMIGITFTMLFNGGMIPFYLVVRQLGLYDTIWALIFPTTVSTWNLIVMRTGFMSIPSSLEESARIDGANDIVILFRILVPVAFPTIVVILLFYVVGHWNAWFNAMLFIRRHELFPLQLILREILIQNSTDSMMIDVVSDVRQFVTLIVRYAVIIVSTIPVLCVYPFLQRYFVKGIMVGSIKG